MAAAVRDLLALHAMPLTGWVEAAAKFRAVVRSEVSDTEEKNRLLQQFVDTIRTGNPPDPPDSKRLSDWKAWLEKLKA